MSVDPSSVNRSDTISRTRRILRPIVLLLSFLFLFSALLNLGVKIPFGLSFSQPSASIASFELVIGIALIVAAVLSNLYVSGGAFLLAAVGIVEGLLSSEVQGLARALHEAMVPVLIISWILIIVDARYRYKSSGHFTSGQKNRQIVTVLQFFVGGLVTLGGAAFARLGTYPIGTIVGLGHLAVGLAGLFAGYTILRSKSWSQRFLVEINILTIVYSTFSESLAEIYGLLPPGINDALIGTIIAIIVSGVIIWLVLSRKPFNRNPERPES